MKERDIIDALQANEPFWGLTGVRIISIDLKPSKSFDIEFELKFGDTSVTVYGEIKSQCTPKLVQEIAPWLARLKETQGGAAYALICPSLSPQAQEICDQNKVDFIDLAGNISINVPGKFLIKRTGVKNKKTGQPSIYRDPFSGRSSRVLRVLLRDPKEWTLTRIADELNSKSIQSSIFREGFGVSLTSISRTLRSLEEEVLIRRSEQGIQVPDLRRLLQRWADKYKERYRWYLRRSFKCPNPFGRDLQIVTRSLKNLTGPSSFVFTGAAATTVTAPFVDVETVDLFVSNSNVGSTIRDLVSKRGFGPDIRVIYPYDVGVFMYSKLEKDLPIVSDIQAYLDLYAQGGRDFKQAQYLLEERIEPRWRSI